MSERKLKTLEEHNNQVFETLKPIDIGTGVQCPHCGAEMFYENIGIVLASYPPQKYVYCKSCDHRTTMFV